MKITLEGLTTQNPEHFLRLLEFLDQILLLCRQLNIEPVLSGSLAVLLYSRDTEVVVNDIDLACHERDFARLSQALLTLGIAYRLREWHVLQIYRDNLKIEFDSIEHWMLGLSGKYEILSFGEALLHKGSCEGGKSAIFRL